MAIKLANNAKSSLPNAIGAADLQIKVQLGDESKFPTLSVGDWFYLTIISEPTYGTDSEIFEIVKVTAITLNTLDVERGAEGTTPQAFAVNDICEQRVTMQTLMDLGGPIVTPPKERIYLDEIYLQKKNGTILANGNELKFNNERYAPKLVLNWDSYWGSRVKVSIENQTDGITYDDLQFNTLDDVVTWKDAHSVGNTQTIIMRPYEEIDQSIPVMTKMFGMNRFLAGGKGKRNYTSGKRSTAKFSSNMEGIFAVIANQMMGSAFTGFEPNFLDIIWFGRNTKNKYIKAPFADSEYYSMDLNEGAQDRHVWDSAVNNTAIALAKAEEYKNTSYNYMYYGLDLNWNLSRLGNSWHKSSKAVIKGYSVVIVAELRGQTSSNQRVVVMKPVGIDQIIVDYVDFNTYELEFLYFNNDKQSFVDIKTFTSQADFSSTDFDPDGGKMRINSLEWINGSSFSQNMMTRSANGRNSLGFDTVYLRLRNKATGAVGNLSYAYIEFEKIGNKMAGNRFMVKNQKR